MFSSGIVLMLFVCGKTSHPQVEMTWQKTKAKFDNIFVLLKNKPMKILCKNLYLMAIFFCKDLLLQAGLPTQEECCNKLQETKLFSDETMYYIDKIESEGRGLMHWEIICPRICNSRLNEENQVKLLMYWLALGIQQTNENDPELNKMITVKLKKYKEDPLMSKCTDPCSLEELEEAFKINSNSSSPIDSPKKVNPVSIFESK